MAEASDIAPRTITMVKHKETKGTYVYNQEVDVTEEPPCVKTLYVEKWALTSNPPERISVTITPIA